MQYHHILVNNKKIALYEKSSSSNNASIILIHGFGEHISRHEEFINLLSSYNYSVWGIDLYGHGNSDGKRGTLPNIGFYNEIIDNVLIIINEKFQNKPIIMFGHSMGGNICLNYILKKNQNIRALILSSPWIELSKNPTFLEKTIALIFNKIIPNLTLKATFDYSFLSRIEKEVNQYKNDILVHDRISIRLFNEMISNSSFIKQNISKLSIPTLTLHGDADNITSFEASKKLSLQNYLITFNNFSGGYHELMKDECKNDVFDTILDWLSLKVIYKF